MRKWERIGEDYKHQGWHPITLLESQKCRIGAKKDGSPGSDLITNRMREKGGEKLDRIILDFQNLMLNTESIPDQFRTDIVVPLYKKRKPI